MFFTLIRALKINAFVYCGLILTCGVLSAETLPVLTAVSRTSPATVAPGNPVSFTVTYTEGSNPLMFFQVTVVDASGQSRYFSELSSSSGGVVTGNVESSWLNGTYTVTDVYFYDVSGRGTNYRRDGTISSIPPLAGAPTTHAIDFAPQNFQVTGAQTTYSLPTLTSVTRMSDLTVSPGATIKLKLTYTEGTSPVSSLYVRLLDPSGANRYIYQSSPVSGDVVAQAVSSTWLDGLYRIESIVLYDQSERSITYNRNGFVVVTPVLAGAPVTHALNFASEGTQVTGGLASITLPRLASITRTSPAAIKVGDSASFRVTYTAGNTPLHAIQIVLSNANGLSQIAYKTTPVSGDVITANTNVGWSEGNFRVQDVIIQDIYDRSTRFLADGSILVDPSIAGAATTHAVSFAGQSFQLVHPPVILTQPQDLQTAPGALFTLSVQATGDGLQHQWYHGVAGNISDPVVGATTANLVTQVSSVSSYWIRVSNLGGMVDSRTATVSVGAIPQTIVFDPLPNKVYGDAPFTLQATATSGLPLSFEVLSGPATIAGATVTLTGTGSVAVRASQAGNASFAAALAVDRSFSVTAPASQLVNISARSYVGTGADVQIAGFIISGNAPKTVIIRASGPALTKYGVSGTLADPVMELHQNGVAAILGTNDDWDASSLLPAFQAAGIDNWAIGSKDAAMLITLNPGAYTAVVSGKNETTGVALIEVYAVGSSDSKLVNLSDRSLVKSGSEVQIAGFIISGTKPKPVVIRVSGPALANYGVPQFLSDPVVEIHQSGVDTPFATNDDWDAATVRPVFQQLGIDNWTVGSKDAALVLTLNPGGYTAVVSGKNNTSGVALIEVYEGN